MTPPNPDSPMPAALGQLVSNEGRTLAELSGAAPVLVVFLRHLNCPFCRQTLADLRDALPALREAGIGLALVHMADDQPAAAVFHPYGLDAVPRFSDRERVAYRAMQLGAVPLRELFGGATWRRAFQAALREGGGFDPGLGNLLQMPGVFVVDQGQVVAGRPFLHVGERPDYRRLVEERAFAHA